MKRQLWMAVALVVAGVMLAAATIDSGLPATYWDDDPQATITNVPHDWSGLEADLRPEACAQCHSEQFDVWKKSLHAQAYSAGLIGQFPAMGHFEANNCLDCHAPLQEQLYKSTENMNQSIALKLKHADGFNVDGELDELKLPLRHSGVSCAVCHVRGGKRFGPPPKNSDAVGIQKAAAHGGFTATRAFEQSQFCASCHQFPQSMAINGKPLENTLVEWEQSTFSEKGITCQQCHMPDRRHEFRGIHDADMVRKGLEFKLRESKDAVIFSMISTWIGHAFPTYVTPKVIVLADALGQDGESLRQWQWEIVREVEYDNGWQEKRDTRLMPGERRDFIASSLPEKAVRIRYRVTVIPDHFYKGIYQGLLADDMTANARTHIGKASKLADRNDYLLYEQELELAAVH